MSDRSDPNRPFLDQLERLWSKSRSLREKATEANQKAAYIADSVETFATGFRSILNTRSTEDDDLQPTISSGFQVGSTLEMTLDNLYGQAEQFTSALDQTLPVFSSSSSAVVATCNSLTLGAVSLPFRKCPFLPDSEEAGYADRLAAFDPNLGSTYRSAWNAFYAEPDDPGRTALWQMRQAYDHFFSRLAPDEVVRQSGWWSRKTGDKPNAVYRDERLRCAAARWISDLSQRQVLLASVEETVRTYQRLGKAHERGPIPVGNAREIFLAVDSIIKRWVDAISPWPPK